MIISEQIEVPSRFAYVVRFDDLKWLALSPDCFIVPLPAGIYLFLSGLVGLGLMESIGGWDYFSDPLTEFC